MPGLFYFFSSFESRCSLCIKRCTRGDRKTATVLKNATPLKIIGERLGSVKQVKFDGVVHDHGAVTDTQVIVNLTQQELAAAKTIKISVVGDNGESPAKDFRIM